MATSAGTAKPRRAPPCLPGAEQQEARDRWLATVSHASPYLATGAESLLSRLSPPRWALEWSLPYWLGQSLDLPAGVALTLVTSNLFGLGFVRLTDDLLDREAAGPPAVLLASTLQQLWIGSLRELLCADAAFWNWFDACLAQWRSATFQSLQPPLAPPGRLSAAEITTLGHRGAPLKVCIGAACLLAGRPGHITPLAAAVDSLLAGAVLVDQYVDWESDLASGRPNAFTSYMLAGSEAVSRARVRASLLAAEGAGDYFATTRSCLADAAGQAEAAGVAPLAQFARWLDDQAVRLDRELRRSVREAYAAAGAQLR